MIIRFSTFYSTQLVNAWNVVWLKVSGLAVLGLGVWLHVNGDSLFYTHLVRASPHAAASSATVVSS